MPSWEYNQGPGDRETPEAFYVFRQFLSLGPNRKLLDLLHVGQKKPTTYYRAKKYAWFSRAEDFDLFYGLTNDSTQAEIGEALGSKKGVEEGLGTLDDLIQSVPDMLEAEAAAELPALPAAVEAVEGSGEGSVGRSPIAGEHQAGEPETVEPRPTETIKAVEVVAEPWEPEPASQVLLDAGEKLDRKRKARKKERENLLDLRDRHLEHGKNQLKLSKLIIAGLTKKMAQVLLRKEDIPLNVFCSMASVAVALGKQAYDIESKAYGVDHLMKVLEEIMEEDGPELDDDESWRIDSQRVN